MVPEMAVDVSGCGEVLRGMDTPDGELEGAALDDKGPGGGGLAADKSDDWSCI